MAYWEQLGSNRHWAADPNKKVFAGDSVTRYTRTSRIKMD